MSGIGSVSAAAVAFVGTHFLLSHPLRRPVVSLVGERVFLGIYSVVAIATILWLVAAFGRAPPTPPLWAVGEGLWTLVTVVMLLASILLMGSLIRNPAFPGVRMSSAPEPRGVYAVTRHPMMWSFALWGLCHMAVFPVAANLVLSGTIAFLALVGAGLQDLKKKKLQPATWPAWEARTSYWPFGAILQGKARLGGFGWHALAGGFVVWLVATWAHIPVARVPAGIWHWIT
jgi:uncharacterized membrane protein